MGILHRRINGWEILPPLGFVILLGVAIYLGIWLGADNVSKRLMWDGIPPSKIIAYYYFVPDVYKLQLLTVLVVAFTVTLFGRWPWWIAGILVMALFIVIPEFTVYVLIKGELGKSFYLVHDDSGLVGIYLASLTVWILGTVVSLVFRGVRLLLKHLQQQQPESTQRTSP